MDNYFNDYEKLAYKQNENMSSFDEKNNGPLVPLSNSYDYNFESNSTSDSDSVSNYTSSSEKAETVSAVNEETRHSSNTRSILGDNSVLNLFGFKLHSDDLIILGVLLFLFFQESDDIPLYIVLILLLLS